MWKSIAKLVGKVALAGVAAVGGGIVIQGAQTEAREIGDRIDAWRKERNKQPAEHPASPPHSPGLA